MVIRPELIDELLQDTNPQDLLREGGLLKQLTKALVERCLETELDTHLEQTKQTPQGKADKHFVQASPPPQWTQCKDTQR